MIRVVAVDDQSLILDALETAIGKQDDMQLVATANHGSKLFDLIGEYHPDVAITDAGMSTGKYDPVAAIGAIKKQYPNVPVLVLTGYKSGVLARALVKAGASGYLLKSDTSECIAEAIYKLYAGGRYFSTKISGELIDDGKERIRLSRREQNLLTLLSKGKSTELMAESLVVTPKRIRHMLMTIRRKMGMEKDDDFSSRIAMINKARELGLLPDSNCDPNLEEIL